MPATTDWWDSQNERYAKYARALYQFSRRSEMESEEGVILWILSEAMRGGVLSSMVRACGDWHDRLEEYEPKIPALNDPKIAASVDDLEALRFVWSEQSTATFRKMSRDEFEYTKYWQTIELAVFARDGNACVVCASTDTLVCHHKRHANYGRELFAIDDLTTLCCKCNGLFEAASKMGQKDLFHTRDIDWPMLMEHAAEQLSTPALHVVSKVMDECVKSMDFRYTSFFDERDFTTSDACKLIDLNGAFAELVDKSWITIENQGGRMRIQMVYLPLRDV